MANPMLVRFCQQRLNELDELAESLVGAELTMQTKGSFQASQSVHRFLDAHNPQSMTQRVQAGRRLIDWATDEALADIDPESGFSDWSEIPLRCLAQQFASHPAYQREWDK